VEHKQWKIQPLKFSEAARQIQRYARATHLVGTGGLIIDGAFLALGPQLLVGLRSGLDGAGAGAAGRFLTASEGKQTGLHYSL